MRLKTRRFLTGLSRDELQFIAEFVGASILQSAEPSLGSRHPLAEQVAEFQRARSQGSNSPDQDHKIILLLEFLCRSGFQKVAVAVRASHA